MHLTVKKLGTCKDVRRYTYKYVERNLVIILFLLKKGFIRDINGIRKALESCEMHMKNLKSG